MDEYTTGPRGIDDMIVKAKCPVCDEFHECRRGDVDQQNGLFWHTCCSCWKKSKMSVRDLCIGIFCKVKYPTIKDTTRIVVASSPVVDLPDGSSIGLTTYIWRNIKFSIGYDPATDILFVKD